MSKGCDEGVRCQAAGGLANFDEQFVQWISCRGALGSFRRGAAFAPNEHEGRPMGPLRRLKAEPSVL